MSDEKEKSPNKKIDDAIKKLLGAVKTGSDLSPDEVTANCRIVQLAVNWEKVKHNIRDEDEFNAANI